MKHSFVEQNQST